MKIEAKTRLKASPTFSAAFLHGMCGALVNNGESVHGSGLDKIGEENLATQLDYLLAALTPSSRAAKRVALEFPEESAAFWKLKVPEQAKVLQTVFMGI